MKDFVYLDTSFLHSFLAQEKGGLVSSISKENQQSRTETKTDTQSNDNIDEIQAGIKAIFSLFAKVGTKYGETESYSLSQLDAGKEIISMQMHDNAVDDLLKSLIDKGALVTTTASLEVDKYMLIKSKFKLIDLDFIQNILGSKEFEGAMKKSVASGKSGGKANQVPGFSDFGKMLKVMSSLLPSTVYIKQGKVLCPLRAENLRVSPKEILFNYSNDVEITVLGKVSRRMGTNRDLDNIQFESVLSLSDMMSGTTDMMAATMGLSNEGDFIVIPIAAFFESE